MHSYAVDFLAQAEKDLDDISEPVYGRICSAIAGLADDPRPSGVLKVAGYVSRYRIRVGKYRVVYEINDKRLRILVIVAAERGEVYKIMKRR
jgi:mRNA interferase RelE/StbE